MATKKKTTTKKAAAKKKTTKKVKVSDLSTGKKGASVKGGGHGNIPGSFSTSDFNVHGKGK